MQREPRPPIRRGVVVDVNVLFSGFTTTASSPPRQIVEMWLGGIIDLIVSPKLLEEAADVFARPELQKYVQGRGSKWIALLSAAGIHHADPDEIPLKIPADPDDEYLVALAVAADAALVTGDPDLRSVDPPPGFRILTPREFLLAVEEWLGEVTGDEHVNNK